MRRLALVLSLSALVTIVAAPSASAQTWSGNYESGFWGEPVEIDLVETRAHGLGTCYKPKTIAAGLDLGNTGDPIVAGNQAQKYCVTLPGTRLGNIYWASATRTDTYRGTAAFIYDAQVNLLSKSKQCLQHEGGRCVSFQWSSRWEFDARYPPGPFSAHRHAEYRLKVHCNKAPRCWYDRKRLD